MPPGTRSASASSATGSDVMTALAEALRDRRLAERRAVAGRGCRTTAAAFRAAGWVTRLDPKTGNWRIATEGMDFDDYWASRPGQLRSTFKRRAKAAGLEIVIHDRFDAAAWADYEAVYRASWKPEEGSFAFLRALAEQEGAAGTLRLGLAYKEARRSPPSSGRSSMMKRRSTSSLMPRAPRHCLPALSLAKRCSAAPSTRIG